MIENNKVYTPKEASEFLKVSIVYVNKLCKQGKIKAKNIGLDNPKRNTWRIKGEDLLNFINNK